MNFVGELRPFLKQADPPSNEDAAFPDLIGRDVALRHRAQPEQSGQLLRIHLIGLLVRLGDRLQLRWMTDFHVQVLRQPIVDVEVVRRGFQQGFTTGVALGEWFEVVVLDASLLDQFTVVVTDGHLGLPLVKVYT